ncbi:hypothetical protein C8R43DRAFT_1088096 [Mycena crocata]|nr:hypothetical protein C8R43DRAFT_1088096 [Mycena crocata]
MEVTPEVLEREACSRDGDGAVDSIITADEIAEWVDTVLDDAAPLAPAELGSLAGDCLKHARKSHDFRGTVLFAALVDFYRWIPCMGRLRAALRVAKYHGRGPAFQRVICAQARYFEANGCIQPSRQGQRKKQKGLLDDEGFYMGVQCWLQTLAIGTVNPKLLQQHINETLLPSIALKKTRVSISHCQCWLWKLGYRRKRHHKGVYWDGHECKDVKKRRKDRTWPNPPTPQLGEDEVEHVIIVDNESTIHSNDYQNNHYWLKAGEQVLKKKGRGRLIMISGFLCERYGLLALTDEMVAKNAALTGHLRLVITDSTTVIYPDNKPGGDSYWNLVQMIAQLVHAILIARRLFPKAIIHWVFDNSSAHGSLAPDALTATKMNVNLVCKSFSNRGKVPEMRDVIIPLDNPHGHGRQVQKMTFDKDLPEDHPHKKYEGLPKGMKVILAEHGYTTNSEGKNLIGDCKGCKVLKSRKPHLDGASPDEEAEIYGNDPNDSDEEEDERPVDCCMRRLLSHQSDFACQKSQLELIDAAGGMVCHHLPKFHPEMNPIEYFWAWTRIKPWFRERSTGNWQKAKQLVAEAPCACPLATIRRLFRRANRYASVYRLGATGPVAEFAVKKYCSHRGVLKTELDVAMALWERKAKSGAP